MKEINNYKDTMKTLYHSNKFYGQWETDKIILSYFDKENGFCIDVGASDGEHGSNTLYFEKAGWDCFCIEPNPFFYESLKEKRKKFIQVACGQFNKNSQRFNTVDIGKDRIQSSLSSLRLDDRLLETHKDVINDIKKIWVRVRSLDSIIADNNLQHDIDFISIDTEGTELDVLKGLSMDKLNITLLVIENNFKDKNISDYLIDFGYKLDQRYKVNDFYVKK